MTKRFFPGDALSVRPADGRGRGVVARGPRAAGVPGAGGHVAPGQRTAHQGAALVVDVQLEFW